MNPCSDSNPCYDHALRLHSQVQDLMFMVEQQTKVAALPEAAQAELRGGSLVLTASPTAGAGKAAGKRKGAKK